MPRRSLAARLSKPKSFILAKDKEAERGPIPRREENDKKVDAVGRESPHATHASRWRIDPAQDCGIAGAWRTPRRSARVARHHDPGSAPIADLKLATVYVMPLGGNDVKPVVEALARNKKYLRAAVAAALNLRYAPDLRFKEDKTFEEATRIDRLLDSPKVRQDIEKK